MNKQTKLEILDLIANLSFQGSVIFLIFHDFENDQINMYNNQGDQLTILKDNEDRMDYLLTLKETN